MADRKTDSGKALEFCALPFFFLSKKAQKRGEMLCAPHPKYNNS